jgi:hypothetical protein
VLAAARILSMGAAGSDLRPLACDACCHGRALEADRFRSTMLATTPRVLDRCTHLL